MSERKVTSKYYPPDFDHNEAAKLSRQFKKRTKHLNKDAPSQSQSSQQVKIRMMLPMSIRCTVCGEYIGRGKKFNSRKEVVQGESYLGLKVFRFYIRCTKCASELTFKTDPKNSTYVSEQNCIRNYTPWSNTSQDDLELEEDERRRLGILSGDDDGDKKGGGGGMGGDAMQMLENKTMEMRQEMDLLDDLDELKTISAQNRRISVDELRERWLKMNREKGSHNSKQEQNLVKNENENGENENDSEDLVMKRGEPRLTDEEELELREFEQDLFTQQDNDNDYDEEGEENDDGNVIGTGQHETVMGSDPILAPTGASTSSSSSFMIGFKKRKQEQEQEKEENGKRQKLENGGETRAQSGEDHASSTLANDLNGAADKSVSNDASISNNSLFNGVDISVVKSAQQTNGKKKKNGGAKKSKKSKSSALSGLCQYGDDD